jgi:hypothetical protein
LQQSFPGLTDAQAAAFMRAPVDGQPGSKTWQATFEEFSSQSSYVGGTGLTVFQGQMRSGEKMIPVWQIARAFTRTSQGLFSTILDSDAAQALLAFESMQKSGTMTETLRRVGYALGPESKSVN